MSVHAIRKCLLPLLLTVLLSGCAVYQKCGFAGCPGDAEITAAVKAEIDNHPDFGPVGNFTIKTLDGVVYISGKVDTDLQKQAVEDVLATVPNVRRVVNSVNTNNTSH